MRRLNLDAVLDGLLALMVITSLLLSAKLWFPSLPAVGAPEGTLVQTVPPASYAAMPVIYRPDRILLRRSDGQSALLMSSSDSYERIRSLVVSLVNDLTEPVWVGEAQQPSTEGDQITLYLPYPLTFGQLSDEWAWDGLAGRGASFRVDQILVQLDESGWVWLMGPGGGHYRLGPLPAADRQELRAALRAVDASIFRPYRLLKEVQGISIRGPLWVPTTDRVPEMTLVTMNPERAVEEARFFPDPSVVRQMDEEGAVNLTDGQRLLRLTEMGVLEFVLARQGHTGERTERPLEVIRHWVGENGGWPRDVVLTRVVTQGSRTLYQFDLRLVGPYPVESSGGALQVQLSDNQVISFRRYPSVAGLNSARSDSAIISPETALSYAVNQVPMMQFSPVRDAYLSYQIRPDEAGNTWEVEPTWVFRSGDGRIYVPARQNGREPHVTLIR
jgi:hypothetical protein